MLVANAFELLRHIFFRLSVSNPNPSMHNPNPHTSADFGMYPDAASGAAQTLPQVGCAKQRPCFFGQGSPCLHHGGSVRLRGLGFRVSGVGCKGSGVGVRVYQTRALLSLVRISLSALWRISACEGSGSRV